MSGGIGDVGGNDADGPGAGAASPRPQPPGGPDPALLARGPAVE